MAASSPVRFSLARFFKGLDSLDPVVCCGNISQVIGLTIESRGPITNVGELCEIPTPRGEPLLVETVGFLEDRTILMPLGEMAGIGPGSPVVAMGTSLRVRVGDKLLGRVIDGLGRPVDGKGPVAATDWYPAHRSPPNALERKPITEPLSVGVRCIDGTLTVGRGQRLGIFAGSGVGKSILLGMIARNTSADVSVIALVGERGREVREFIERDLGEEGLKRSCVVAATSDQPPLVRIKAALVATAVAEYFRDKGLDVVLMMDSVTRFAMAQREVGLAVGEPPATRGYTPSVFALLPRLLERAGSSASGTITGFYTVLVDGDDFNEPIADAIRGTLDGHIVLSRELASIGHYPAIDVLASVSRVMPRVTSAEHQHYARLLRATVATYRDAQDLINIGAYVPGSNPKIDFAISVMDGVNAYLRQGIPERAELGEALSGLAAIFGHRKHPF